MVENYSPPPTYFILLLITITRLISTVGNKTEQHLHRKTLLPPELAFNLQYDQELLQSASRDFGNLVHDLPRAVFYPHSAHEIVRLVRASYESPLPFCVAAKGQGHSTRGQAMARDGVVVEMKALREERKGNGIRVVLGDFSNHDNDLYYHYADVGGEQLWIDVLHETMKHGLAPVSWTDYLYLTVGGTLSNAGISGQTFRYGPQISNVREMDVITGKGELITCSQETDSELFNAVLGGLGQFGIIARARIVLHPAPKRVKWVRLLYNDFSAFTKDQEGLISMNNGREQNMTLLDYVEGMLLMHQGPINNWRSSFFPLADHPRIISLVTEHTILYCLEFAKYYYDHDDDDDENSENNNVDKELQSLVQGLSYVPGFYYEKKVSYVEFLNRVRSGELKLQSQGLWDVPHPWLNLFIPKSQIMDFDSGVFKNIILKRNITTGPVLIYPMNRNKWDNRMSASIPDDEDIFYTVGFLHSSGFDNWKAFDAQNREIMNFCDDSGIKVKQYLPHYSTQKDWTKHFGSNKWRIFLERKHQFDPRMILSPGQRIFNNNYIQSF